MQIILNGEQTDIREHASISELLSTIGVENQRVAVEVNHQVIPRGEHISFILSASDTVEIIHAVGGG